MKQVLFAAAMLSCAVTANAAKIEMQGDTTSPQTTQGEGSAAFTPISCQDTYGRAMQCRQVQGHDGHTVLQVVGYLGSTPLSGARTTVMGGVPMNGAVSSVGPAANNSSHSAANLAAAETRRALAARAGAEAMRQRATSGNRTGN